MARLPTEFLPSTPSAVESRPEAKPGERAAAKDPNWGRLKRELPEEELVQLRPGMKLPDGRRVPPPPRPHPRGQPFPQRKAKDGKEHALRLFNQDVKLRTRAECEKVCQRIVNWLKDDVIDANKANAMLNGVGKVLQSKTITEEMQLKVADREILRRIREMEETVGLLEDAAGAQRAPEGLGKLQ